MKTAIEYNRELMKNIVPKMSYNGKNFDEWKKSARKKLSELLGLDKFTKVEPKTEIEYEKKLDGATEIRFTFQSEDGYRVPCHILLPDGIEKPPVIICLQGHSTGMHISLGNPIYESDERTIKGGDRDFCVRALKEGFAAVALEQRNFGECGGDEKGPKCLDSSLLALLLGRTTIGERVWDIMRLIDVLETEFADRIDTHCISCMGNSGGGTTTVYAASLEDRLVLAMPSCAMCTYKDSIGAVPHCSCNYVPGIAEFFDMGDLMAMAYPKYFIQVSGPEDRDFRYSGAQEAFQKGRKAYADQGKEELCTLVTGFAGHRFYADDSWPIVHKYLNK